ncbi:TetR family transcriptional regulator [Desulfoferula mesophila]|uniref:HTH tetR-type domain-containing protein n=1 Tax=Desulfoferula mesophila TaxID=3058419 RepID=A0AAU9E8U0_9BACT|nr:hypothetical protein FAK_06290 [Desulfoferula mesophilus]
MARRTNEQAQQTRENILRGALDVFSEKGFSRSTLSDIAKRIGMTRGAVYWHFKDKQELLVELIEAMHLWEYELLYQRVPTVDTLEDLERQFQARVDFLDSDPKFRQFIRFMSMQVEWATEKRIFDHLRDGNLRNTPFRDFERVLTQEQQRGRVRPEVDVAEICDILVGLFTGMVRLYLSGMSKRPLECSMKTAVRGVLDSIRA